MLGGLLLGVAWAGWSKYGPSGLASRGPEDAPAGKDQGSSLPGGIHTDSANTTHAK